MALTSRQDAFARAVAEGKSHGADCWRYLAMAEPQMTNDDWGGSLHYPKMGYA